GEVLGRREPQRDRLPGVDDRRGRRPAELGRGGSRRQRHDREEGPARAHQCSGAKARSSTATRRNWLASWRVTFSSAARCRAVPPPRAPPAPARPPNPPAPPRGGGRARNGARPRAPLAPPLPPPPPPPRRPAAGARPAVAVLVEQVEARGEPALAPAPADVDAERVRAGHRLPG